VPTPRRNDLPECLLVDFPREVNALDLGSKGRGRAL